MQRLNCAAIKKVEAGQAVIPKMVHYRAGFRWNLVAEMDYGMAGLFFAGRELI